jgi:hypothetical protein
VRTSDQLSPHQPIHLRPPVRLPTIFTYFLVFRTSLQGAITTVIGNGQLTTIFVNFVTDVPVVNHGGEGNGGLGQTDKIALGIGLGIGLPLLALLIIILKYRNKVVIFPPFPVQQNQQTEIYKDLPTPVGKYQR